jgi:hypothetical protein
MTHKRTPSHDMPLLGECIPTLQLFPDRDESLHHFATEEFRALSWRKQIERVSEELVSLIDAYPTPCFLLRAVLDFIEHVNHGPLSGGSYSLVLFELWLNQFSGLTQEHILQVRGKIVGRYMPRDEYQSFFTIGKGKTYQGSHFVAAHLSPDVDTTVSSFWGWADAFGCRVAEGTHQWSLPKGLSDGHICLFMQKLFGAKVFENIPRSLPTITISALDLLTERAFHKVQESARADSVDHGRAEHAVIIVDEQGLYKGEWRSGDAEEVRRVVSGLSHCLRWFEAQCHAGMIRLLAKESCTMDEVQMTYDRLLDFSIKDCSATKDIPVIGRKLFHEYLLRIIGLPKGIHHSFRELLLRLDVAFASTFHQFFEKCRQLQSPGLFTSQGLLMSDRTTVGRAIECVVEAMERALEIVRDKAETLSHFLEVKRVVLKFPSTFVTLTSDVDEMRSKIDHFDHLTVVMPETDNAWYPVGVVYADDLKKSVLGTASFRDFSSVEETKMASYVEVISIVDHHKIRLQTSTAPTLVTGDVQSSNTLVAEQSLRLNARYNQSGKEGLESAFFVDPARELSEYFSYIYGILDDTDLLSKVSRRDVVVLKDVLNRMRCLIDGTPSVAVSFDHIADDKGFVAAAAKALLRNEDLHSIYASVYRFREKEVEEALTSAISGLPSTLFMDTKEQNGCCRVGQVKLFHNNIPTYESHRQGLITLWQKNAESIYVARSHLDLFIQMVSTVPSEKEVYYGHEEGWTHQDEMWIWTPEGGVPEQHLIGFLNSFEGSPAIKQLAIEIKIVGPMAEKRKAIFVQNFTKARHIVVHETSEGPTIAFMRYRAGALNSRKAQVSPFLPKVLP